MRRIELGEWNKNLVLRRYDEEPLSTRKKMDDAGVKPLEICSLDDVRRLPFTSKVEHPD